MAKLHIICYNVLLFSRVTVRLQQLVTVRERGTNEGGMIAESRAQIRSITHSVPKVLPPCAAPALTVCLQQSGVGRLGRTKARGRLVVQNWIEEGAAERSGAMAPFPLLARDASHVGRKVEVAHRGEGDDRERLSVQNAEGPQ